jgi:hypothetical protein
MDEKRREESRQDHETVVDTSPKSYRVLSLAGPHQHAAVFCFRLDPRIRHKALTAITKSGNKSIFTDCIMAVEVTSSRAI